MYSVIGEIKGRPGSGQGDHVLQSNLYAGIDQTSGCYKIGGFNRKGEWSGIILTPVERDKILKALIDQRTVELGGKLFELMEKETQKY